MQSAAGRWMWLRFRRPLLPLVCAVFTLFFLPCIRAQSDDDYLARKNHAVEIYKQFKYTEALPLLEKLHAEKPGDIVVLECLSFSTLAHAATLKDEVDRKQERVHARKLAEEAKAAGNNSNLLKAVLDVPEDGGEVSFSDNAAVDTVMKEAEAAFARGAFSEAIGGYNKALALNPKQYTSALFIGDVYYKEKDYLQAGRWFQKAIEIEPNRETAHRYWGDSLTAENKMSEAKEQFIAAIVAEPSSRIAWTGLSQWAQHQKMFLANPKIEILGKVEDNGVDAKGHSQTTITIDSSLLGGKENKDGTKAWMFYGIIRAPWHGEKFNKEFPNEKEYRHSLPEEVEALQFVVNQVKEGIKNKEIEHPDPSLANLVKLSDEGLLETYVLISRADAGIMRDYPAFRDAHREKIQQYISKWLIYPAP
jgi:tetratricopeptide (TPR) repeat protein